MSIQYIRGALETHLRDMPGLGLPIAYENAPFNPPVDGSAYVETRCLFAAPDDAQQGSLMFFERGVFQVTLCYPLSKGVGSSDAKAIAVRNWYARGTSLVRSGITTHVVDVPRIVSGISDNGIWRVPVSVNWQAQVST